MPPAVLAGFTVNNNSGVGLNTATFSLDGNYTLRLTADDGSVSSFDQVSFAGFSSPFAEWQAAHFVGGSSNPNAAPGFDPDFDGRTNLLEYATGTDPNAPSNIGIVYDVETIGAEKFLRVTITKIPPPPR